MSADSKLISTQRIKQAIDNVTIQLHHEHQFRMLFPSREKVLVGGVLVDPTLKTDLISGIQTDTKLAKRKGLVFMDRPTSLEPWEHLQQFFSLKIRAIDLGVRENVGKGLTNANIYRVT